MRILLDQMFSPVIARQLRDRGHDVEAVLEHDELIGLADPPLFAAAQSDERALVTENVSDHMPLHVQHSAAGHRHHGLIFTSNTKFPRGVQGAIGALVTTLDQMLSDPPPLQPADGWIHWL